MPLLKIKVGSEWAYIVTDDDLGLFCAHGSYGTFAYVWPPQHRSQPLHAFLADLDFHYFIRKTRGLTAMEFDFDGTFANLRRCVLNARRTRYIGLEAARDAWDILDSIDQTNSPDFLAAQIFDETALVQALGDDWMLEFRDRYCPQCTEFWRVIWPAFMAKIQAPEAAHG